MIKAVVFDLDDTLYPEHEYVLSGFRAVSDELEREIGCLNAFQELEPLFLCDKRGVFDRFIAKNSLSVSADALHEIYINHFPRIAPFVDVPPCFAELRQSGFKLGIITDGRPVQQKNKLTALGIADFGGTLGRPSQSALTALIDVIIITDVLGIEFRKPHPKAFEVMKEGLGVDYNEIVYVGDNPAKDFFVGALHPILTVQILRNGYYGGDYYCGIAPCAVIESLDKLTQTLENLDKEVMA